jgi:hypothetical protein
MLLIDSASRRKLAFVFAVAAQIENPFAPPARRRERRLPGTGVTTIMRINTKIAISALLVLAASSALASDHRGHRQSKELAWRSHARVRWLVPASTTWSAWGAWGLAREPTSSMCDTLEGYPDCH